MSTMDLEKSAIFATMKTYIFTGNQPINFTLPDGTDVVLEKDVAISLDPENHYIAGLIGLGYLIEVKTKDPKK